MASLSSITGTLSSTSSLRGYGGLSSGLDRDSLIESLTYGTRNKIEAQQAKKEKLEWEQTAIRSIIDKVYNFSNTYASYASSTNISSSSFFARNNVSAIGENSKYVSVSGTASSAELMSIVGIKNLAQDAKLTGGAASASQITTGQIDLDAYVSVDQLEGQYISFKYGDKTYHADLGSIDMEKYKTDPDGAVADVLNNAFKEVELADGKTLDKVLTASVSGGKVTLTGNTGNKLEIIGGTALQNLGFLSEGQSISDLGEEALSISSKSITAAGDVNAVDSSKTGAEYLRGKTLTFSYNGTSKNITLGNDITDLASLQKDLQNKLTAAFGKGRIDVGTKNGTLTFTTTTPDGEVDRSSTLSLTGGSKGLLGEDGVLGIKSGQSNRVDLSKSLTEAGLANSKELVEITLADGQTKGYSMIINGERFEFAKDASIQSIINTVNSSNAGVTISYHQNSDRFTIASKEKGASGSIDMYGGIAEALFGPEIFTTDRANSAWNSAVAQGQDAVIAVQYAGDSTVTEIRRDSNTFTMDGLTVSVKGAFGYSQDGSRIEETEAISFKAEANTDAIIKGIKDMVNAYNEIVALINSELKTKPDKDYKSPLTGSQKEDLSDDEIEEYEKKAKQGLLFGDNDLRSFATDLRYVLTSADIAAFAEIGITESSEYSDNGKLVIDEAKLKAALESDPEKVSKLFTSKKDVDGKSGLMENISNVMDKYCKTMGATKGLLVERAGSEHSPLSILSNTLKTEMDDISDFIETLLDRLEAEEDRYIKQFTSLETLISQMNSQSSYLSSLGNQ